MKEVLSGRNGCRNLDTRSIYAPHRAKAIVNRAGECCSARKAADLQCRSALRLLQYPTYRLRPRTAGQRRQWAIPLQRDPLRGL